VAEGDAGEVRLFGEIANTPEALQKMVNQLSKARAEHSFCCESGPCGYVIHRQLRALGLDCQVVAHSLIPRKAGDRVKTDRRDALSLALSKRFKSFDEHIQKAASESDFWPLVGGIDGLTRDEPTRRHYGRG
jgi:transposase